jgi:hypothetical protein
MTIRNSLINILRIKQLSTAHKFEKENIQCHHKFYKQHDSDFKFVTDHPAGMACDML